MDKKTVSLIGVPMDLGGNRRGVDMGPSAFRIAGIEEGVRALGLEFVDRGNVPVGDPRGQEPVDTRAKYLPTIAEACGTLRDMVSETMAEGHFPLVVGGDHSIAVGTVAGVADHFDGRGERIGVIWFDAHSDMNTPESSESGNVHGMPLAAITGQGPQALTQLGGLVPLVESSRVAMIGIRSVDGMEAMNVKDSDVACFTMREVDEQGIRSVMEQAIAHVTRGTAGFHLSFDVDGTDPSVCPGVGTPVAGGISYREAHTVMELAAASKKLLSLEMVEINPILDNGNKTSIAAKEFALSALGKSIL
ncbi:MAG: arginase [Planctomycetota bacterium]|nr:arginase [Planctomycetota bacterium]MEC8511160.1 arginase [Planctomycetota bacterium]MEE2941562.1 arginase [Planctomycetota bacterium]